MPSGLCLCVYINTYLATSKIIAAAKNFMAKNLYIAKETISCCFFCITIAIRSHFANIT